MNDDILSYKQKIQALEQEKQRLEEALIAKNGSSGKVLVSALVEQMGEGISLADESGAYILVNPAFCRMTGYTASELLHMKVHDLLPPHVEVKLFPQVLNHQPAQREVTLKRKDGSYFIGEVRGYPIQVANRSLVMGIVRDVSERKKTEEALKESEKKLNEIYNATSEAIVIHKIDSLQIIDCNDATVHLYGYASKEEMLKLTIEDVSATDRGYGREAINAQIKKALENGSHTFEWLIKKKNGDVFWVEANIKRTLINGKEILLAVARDISERKQVQHALKEIEQRYTNLFDSLPDEVHVWKVHKNDKGKITGWSLSDANVSALKGWGKPKEEVIGKTPNEIFGYDVYSNFIPIVEQIFETGKPHRWERYFEPTDQYLSMDSIPFGNYFISTGKDISHLKKTELALKESNATKDKFFSIIAHDLRSPFSVLVGFTELIKDNPKSFDERAFKTIIKTINASAKDTLYLLDNLLNWARSQTNQIHAEPERVVLSSLVKEVIKLLDTKAQEKRIHIAYHETEEVTIYADINMIKTVLRNLISNAIKFTDLSGSIDIYASYQEEYTEIAVADNGIGIDEEAQKKLFGSESNESTRGTADEKGTGLGLILCKDFVEKQGGKIWVESQSGEGSTFKIRLPRH